MTTALTESDLYAMAMESDTAYRHMAYLCAVLGFNFPPKLEPPKASSIPDPLTQEEES